MDAPSEQPRKKYDLIITVHARERWVQRIADPRRYEHLDSCKVVGCPTCVSLVHDLRNAVMVCGRGVDSSIAACYRRAKAEGRRVTDVSFMEAVRKKWPEDAGIFDFLIGHRAVLVVSQKPEEDTPILRTVMTTDMVDGMVVRTMGRDEMKVVFKRWKREARNK